MTFSLDSSDKKHPFAVVIQDLSLVPFLESGPTKALSQLGGHQEAPWLPPLPVMYFGTLSCLWRPHGRCPVVLRECSNSDTLEEGAGEAPQGTRYLEKRAGISTPFLCHITMSPLQPGRTGAVASRHSVIQNSGVGQAILNSVCSDSNPVLYK